MLYHCVLCAKYAHIGAEEGKKAIVQLHLDCIYICPPDIGYIIDVWNYLYGIKYEITTLEEVKLMAILITCE